MGILSALFSHEDESERLETAEEFIHEQSALYRHYCIPEVQGHVEQFTSIQLSDEEAVEIVQRLRNEHGMGPISEWNMPGSVSDEDEEEESSPPGEHRFRERSALVEDLVERICWHGSN